MSLCQSIDTLSMAYLDDELAAEERHELEAHLTECASCRAQLDGERADQELLQRALSAPRMPDLVRGHIIGALDDEDRVAAKAARRRLTPYLLPGSAILAAAAAIAVFVSGAFVRSPQERRGSVTRMLADRALPLEVQGPSTGPWLRQNFAAVEPPRIADGEFLGARLLPHGINNHNSALLSYRVNFEGNPVVLSILVVRDLRAGEMTDGDEVSTAGRTLHVIEEDDHAVVTYVDNNHMGYMFMAPELSVNELIKLVGHNLSP